MAGGFGFGPLPGLPAGLTAEDIQRLLAMQAAPEAPQGGGLLAQAAGGSPSPVPPGLGPLSFGPLGGGASQPSAPGFDGAGTRMRPPVVSPDDLARIMAKQPLGAPQAFAGPAGSALPPEPDTTGAVPADGPAGIANPPLSPVRPLSFGPLPPATPPADMPVQGAQPTAMQAAPGFVPPGAPQAAPPVAPGADDGPRRNIDSQVWNTFLGLGQGLLANKGFGNGIAAGVGNVSRLNAASAANDLQRAEFGLKTRKTAQEEAGNNATVALLVSKGHPVADARAMVAAAVAGHGEALANAMNNVVPRTPANFRQNPDGSQSFIPGSEADPNYKRGSAQASAEGTDAGTPAKPFNMGEGQVRYDGTTNQPIVAGPPKAPVTREIDRDDGTKATVQWDGGSWKEVQAPGASGSRATNPFATGKFNNDQGKAAGFSDRMFGSEKVLRGLEGINSGVIGGTQGALASWTPNVFKDADRQRFEQAKADFLNAQLRRESGAAIARSEFDNGERQYFPQPGDKPEVIAQKRLNRQNAVSAMAREGGPAYRPGSIFDESGAIVANPMMATPQRGQGQSRQQSSGTPPPPTAQGSQARFQQLMQSGLSKADAYARMHQEGY